MDVKFFFTKRDDPLLRRMSINFYEAPRVFVCDRNTSEIHIVVTNNVVVYIKLPSIPTSYSFRYKTDTGVLERRIKKRRTGEDIHNVQSSPRE